MLLYVTGALEPAETAALRDHLRSGCPACAGSLAEAEATLHQIPLSLPVQQAPESAWEKLEMRIALQEDAMPIVAKSENRRVAEMTISPSRRPTAFAWTGWAAAAAVAVFMGILLRNANLTADQHIREALAKADEASSNLAIAEQAIMASSNQTQKVAARVASLEQKVKDFDTERAKLLVALDESHEEFRTRFDKLMHAQQFALASADMPGVTGTLYWNKAEGTWTLMASHLQPAAPGKTYELWIITQKGEKIAAGTFAPDAAGNAMHEVPLPADAGPVKLAAVTDEPIGGVVVPTGHVQFLTDVTKTQ
jgi:hypothetical protein